MLALCNYYGKPIIFVPKYIVRLENAAGQNVSCFYRYAIRQFLSNDREMLEDVSSSSKDGKILIKDIIWYSNFKLLRQLN
jgi:hypothetical protein